MTHMSNMWTDFFRLSYSFLMFFFVVVSLFLLF